MSNGSVRVRVAPSPTGDPHVGTAYQALFNYAFAKKSGGEFILRIEDTDRARSTAASEAAILESLKWMGLSWNEGPDVGGPHAPYRQSERLDIYRTHADQLLRSGHAYRCFCTKQRLAAMRDEQRDREFSGYDRHCRDLDASRIERALEEREPFVVRLKIPVSGICVFQDLLRGEISKDWGSVDDQVIVKSDGYPTYHLANVVDDHLMGISHVIRGEEWINSVPKHLKLYEYFGWSAPVFCHLPLLRNNDKNKSKLSKRKNPTSIDYYRRAGFLPEALLNFMGMFGWTRAEGDEKFTLEQFVEHFELGTMSLGGPVFDTEKLRWLNARYIRENLSDADLLARLQQWGLSAERLLPIVELARPRLETLSDWGFLTAFFFADSVPLDVDSLSFKGLGREESSELLQMVAWRLEDMPDFQAETIEHALRSLAEAVGLKMRDFSRVLYVAMTGSAASTPLFHSMSILGSDLSRMRIRRAIEALGGLSAKKQKAAQKRYRELPDSVEP